MTSVPTGKVPQRAAARRAQILEAARTLFNAHGTAEVSTNHIAAAAGVSPGNVYYWFPDKRTIIRALFEEWSTASAPVGPTSSEAGDVLRALIDGVAGQPEVSARFAFFSRELIPLLHADAELAAAYRENFGARIVALEAAIGGLATAGLLHDPGDRAVLRDAIVAMWIASESATGFLELVEPDGATGRPRDVVTAVLRAMLTERGRQALVAIERGR
jgi:TetR/AcrR family transcriptional repressor of uid operon